MRKLTVIIGAVAVFSILITSVWAGMMDGMMGDLFQRG